MDLYEACVANEYQKVYDIVTTTTTPVNFCNPTDDNKTPLHVAAEHLNEEIVQLLIRQGADVTATDRIGLTPFARACIAMGVIANPSGTEGAPCLRSLAQFDSPILTLDQFGNTVIHVLAARGTAAGFMRVCQELASIMGTRRVEYKSKQKHVAESNSIDDEFLGTVDSVWNLDYVVALILLPGWGFLTPLHLVADAGNTPLLLMMLKHMKDKDQLFCQPLDAIGWTPLHWAAMRNNRSSISTLVRYGGRKLCLQKDFMSRNPTDICFSFAHQPTAAWMLRRFVREPPCESQPSLSRKAAKHFPLVSLALVLTLAAGTEASLRVVLLLSSVKPLLALLLTFLTPPLIWWLLTSRAIWKALPLCITKIGALEAAHNKLPHRWHGVRTMGRTVLNQHTADRQPCAVRADLRKDWHALWSQLHEWKNDPLVCVFLWWLQSHIMVSKSPLKQSHALMQVGRHTSSCEQEFTSDSSDSDDTEDPAHIIEIIEQSRAASSAASSDDTSLHTSSDAASSDISLTDSDDRALASSSVVITDSSGPSDSLTVVSTSNLTSSNETAAPRQPPEPEQGRVTAMTAPAVLKNRLKEMLAGGLTLTKGVRRVLPSPPPLSQKRRAASSTSSDDYDESDATESSAALDSHAARDPSRELLESNVLSSLGASHESSGPWAPSWLPGGAVGAIHAASSTDTTTNESNTKHGGEPLMRSDIFPPERGNLLAWWRTSVQSAPCPPSSEDAKTWKQTPHFGSSWNGLDYARTAGSGGSVKNPLLRNVAERRLHEHHLAEGFQIWRTEFISICKFVNEVPHLFCRIPSLVSLEPNGLWGSRGPAGCESLLSILRTRNPDVPENELALAGALPVALKGETRPSLLGGVIDLLRAETCLRSTSSESPAEATPPFTDIDVCHWKLRPLQDLQPLLINVWLPNVLDIAIALIVVCLSEYPSEFVGVVRIAYIKAIILALLALQVGALLLWTLLYKSDLHILCPTNPTELVGKSPA